MYKQRSELAKEVPLPRKGTKYVCVASHFQNKKMPLLFVLRDILKIARTRHEAKKICLDGNVYVNGKKRKDLKFPVGLRDIIKIGDKNYKIFIEHGKYSLKETKEEKFRTLKVIGKIILKGKKVQANLEDGTNLLVKESFNVGDSFVVSIPENKLVKVLPLKEGSKVEVIKGKHLGLKGKVSSKETKQKNMFKIKLEDGEEVSLPKESLLVIE